MAPTSRRRSRTPFGRLPARLEPTNPWSSRPSLSPQLTSPERLSRRRDYLTSFVTESLFILSYLAVFRIVADHFGPRGFAEYALSRRTLAFLLPLGALGLDIAVARFVAYAAGKPREQRSYLPAALVLLAVALAVQVAILLGFQSFWANLFFGSTSFTSLVPALALLVAGNGMFAVAYGNFRGQLKVLHANFFRIIVHALFPFAAALLVRDSVDRFMYVLGAGWILLSLGGIAINRMSFANPVQRATELARYSLPRVPGDLLALVMFAVPGILVAHLSDITVAGNVAFGIAAIGMFAVAAFPVGFVLLPVASRLLASGSIDRLRNQVFNVTRVVVALIVAGIAVFEIFANQIVTIYLGPSFSSSVSTLRVLMLGALPWALYISLRSIIDARHTVPVNAINVAISFAFFGAVMFVSQLWVDPATAVVPVFVISLYALGVLTVIQVWRITRSAPGKSDQREAEPGSILEEPAEPVI